MNGYSKVMWLSFIAVAFIGLFLIIENAASNTAVKLNCSHDFGQNSPKNKTVEPDCLTQVSER